MSVLCPRETEIRAWLDDSLSGTGAVSVQEHVESCAACQQTVERILKEHPSPEQQTARLLDVGPTVDFIQRLEQQPPGSGNQDAAPLFLSSDALQVITIPGYEVLELLGTGGMGVVYKARQLKLNRLVALKVLSGHSWHDPADRSRFLIEAEATASLDHSNIVQIYEIGAHQGLSYLILEYCSGGSLANALPPTGLPPQEAALLLLPLARAVAYAHSKHIIHRDLTPGNVLISSDGVPKIADFGLAKRTDTSTGLTATAAILGTPSYMSPEQARGEGRHVGPATDIHGLGAILYRLLTGRAPFSGDTPMAILHQVMEADPERPSSLRPGLPLDLETICLKCLQKEPGQRYVSADALAEDLRCFLQGKPIRARPVSTAERVWRWAKRNPSWAATLTALGLLLLGIAVASSWAAFRFDERRRAAETSEQRAVVAEETANTRAREAEDARGKVEALLADSLKAVAGEVRGARLRGEQGAYVQGMPRLRAALAKARELHAPPAVLQALRNEMTNLLTATDVEIVREWEDDFPVGTDAVVFAPDLARYFRLSRDSLVTIHETGTGKELSRLPMIARPAYEEMSFSPDGRRLYFNVDDRLNTAWALDGSAATLLFQRAGKRIASTPDARWVLSSQHDGSTEVLDASTGAVVRRLPQGNMAWKAPVHPSRPWVALADGKQILTINYQTGEPVGKPIPAIWGNMCWHPTEPILAIAVETSKKLLIELWDVKMGRQVASPLTGHARDGIHSLFDPSGSFLVSTDWSGITRIWDTASGRQLMHLPLPWAGGSVLTFAPDKKMVGAAIKGKRLQLFRIRPGEGLRIVHRADRAEEGIRTDHRVVCAPDGRWVAAQRSQGTVELLDPASGRFLAALPEGTRLVAVGRTDGAILTIHPKRGCERWPVQLKKDLLRVGPPERLLTPPPNTYDRWGASDNGRVVAAPNYSRGALLWHLDRPPGLLHALPIGPHPDVRQVAVSPDGSWLLAGSHVAGGVTVYDTLTGRLLARRLLDQGGWGCFSSGGRWVVAHGYHGGGKLIRVGTWETVRPLHGRYSAFSPDDRILAEGEGYGKVRLWECATGREIVTLEAPDRVRLAPAGFSPDGGRLYAVGEDDGNLYIWDLRLLRARLQEMDADWNWPTLPPTQRVEPVTRIDVRVQ